MVEENPRCRHLSQKNPNWLKLSPALAGFPKAVQMNKNPFGLAPAGPLQLNAAAWPEGKFVVRHVG